MGNFSLRVDVPVVTVDTAVILQKTSRVHPRRIEGVELPDLLKTACLQTITGFQRIQAPITAVLLLEFAAKNYSFIYDMRNAAWTFVAAVEAG